MPGTRQLCVGERAVHRVDVVDLHLALVVGEHEQGRSGDGREVLGGQRRRAVMFVVEAGPDVGPVLGAVGWTSAYRPPRNSWTSGGRGSSTPGKPALEVEHALGEHQATDQVGPLLRDQEADRSADRVADQVDWLVDDSLDERDRVVGHLRKGDRAADVGCSALTAPVEAVRAKRGGEAVEVAVVGARVGAAGVQQHERFAAPWTSHQVLTSASLV